MSGKIVRCKVFKFEKDRNNYCHECGNNTMALLAGTKWDEISQEEYTRLNFAVGQANRAPRSKWYYVVVIDVSNEDYQEIFDTAQQFIDWEARESKRREDEERKRNEAAQKAALARKQKQLEKLKKELGESS